MNWPTWKADLIAIAISMIIVAPFALYGPLWLRSTGSGGPVKNGGVSVETCRFVWHGRPTIEANGGVTCELRE